MKNKLKFGVLVSCICAVSTEAQVSVCAMSNTQYDKSTKSSEAMILVVMNAI